MPRGSTLQGHMGSGTLSATPRHRAHDPSPPLQILDTCRCVWIGFIWLSIGASDGTFWTPCWLGDLPTAGNAATLTSLPTWVSTMHNETSYSLDNLQMVNLDSYRHTHHHRVLHHVTVYFHSVHSYHPAIIRIFRCYHLTIIRVLIVLSQYHQGIRVLIVLSSYYHKGTHCVIIRVLMELSSPYHQGTHCVIISLSSGHSWGCFFCS